MAPDNFQYSLNHLFAVTDGCDNTVQIKSTEEKMKANKFNISNCTGCKIPNGE